MVLAVPNPKTWTAGEFVDDVELNLELRDALLWLLDPPRCKVRQTTTATSLTTAVWGLVGNLDVEDYDAGGGGVAGHSTVTNPSRYTIQAGAAGTYECFGAVSFAGNAAGRRGAEFRVNGTTMNASQVLLPASVATALCVPARTIRLPLVAGDYVELFGFQDSGGSLSTVVTADQQSGWEIRWVGP